jgi:hypothetical protein
LFFIVIKQTKIKNKYIKGFIKDYNMQKYKEGTITEKIGEELVDNVLEAGLAILLVMSGINYFNLDSKWIEAMKLLTDRVGLGSSEKEISMMMSSVANTFPFNFIQQHQGWTLAIGIFLCVAGVIAKILTLKSKEELIRDIGEIIFVPGIIGVVSIVFIQIMTVNSINDLMLRAQLVSTQLAFSKADSATMIWNMMGLIFLIGFFALIFGSMIYYITKSLGRKPLPLFLFGKFLTVVGWFGLIYYAVIRLFAMDVVAQSLFGSNIIKLFAVSWYISRGTFIVTVLMFALGYTLYSYGRKEIKRKRKLALMEARRAHVVPYNEPGHQTHQGNQVYQQSHNQPHAQHQQNYGQHTPNVQHNLQDPRYYNYYQGHSNQK